MVSLNGAYEFTCPSQAHWNLRAKSMCKPTTNYTCLFDINLQINVYRDRCYRPSIVGPGYKYVFQPNLNRAACSSNRYQPFIFETVGYSDCTFQKSLCNSLGQETYANGDTRVDRKCICNTDRGYTFVRNSNNQCYCNPSTEDCSCYLGNNPYNETVGLEDIKCYHEMKMTRIPYLGDMFNISRTIKINEFDNNKYNIKHLPTTPREFNIIECTDCSMTIGWFIDVPDQCLSYELDHRVRGTDDWSTETFLSGDVMTDEDGRRMYKLQNLKPETYYEFKMRSVYKDDVKSHYSESKTKQTLKLAPREFNIIECTDCSMTIGWFIDVPDECLSYELDHRVRGTDDWSTETFLSGDVKTDADLLSGDAMKDEDGRRMYKLQNLKPETYYEFKMRSIYKDDVKSHYSESKTKQTLKLGRERFGITFAIK
ncbi:unnamed protein product [Mytilus edulis]|uniref:Fibronectin type-III domain-containing protein n=1 Tax=Mytilus edulis TaxID=6550 RepID=A0A8S3PNL3_MYTED|nr:unnamed protein product [Mytilus edulis]